MWYTFFSLLKKPVLYVPFMLVLFGAGWFLLKPDDGGARYETAVAELRDVTQTVSVTGRIVPQRSAALSFERSGTVSSVRVAVGEKVSSGAVLMTLANGDSVARTEQAAAARAAAEAGLAELRAGTRPEERAIKDARYEDAAATLSEARRALFDELRDAYTTADDAIRNKTDQLFNNPRSAHPALTFLSLYKEELEFKRFLIEGELAEWDASLGVLTEEGDLFAPATAGRAHLGKIKEFLDVAALAVNNLTAGALSQATIDGYKANAASARAAIGAALSSLRATEGAVRSRESAFSISESERALSIAGATKEAIDSATARVAEARAREKEARAELGKTILAAPFAGVVSKITPRVGEFAGAAAPVATLISPEDFLLEVFVPEADIAKVRVGNEARVTLDAYGEAREFSARVAAIEPEATLFDGVPAYKATVYFTRDMTGIRAGMTADIDIATGEQNGVLAIPQRAVETRDGVTYVRVLLDAGVPKEQAVITGLRGTDGLIEIVNGLEAGTRVITFEQ